MNDTRKGKLNNIVDVNQCVPKSMDRFTLGGAGPRGLGLYIIRMTFSLNYNHFC